MKNFILPYSIYKRKNMKNGAADVVLIPINLRSDCPLILTYSIAAICL